MSARTQQQDETQAVARTHVERPPLYRVLLHNDDYTPMDFVVAILRDVFHRDEAEAVRIMLHVHKRGIGVAGVYPHQVAETKVHKVHETAKEAGQPLKCTMEEA
jgi:ATP-dependent Clp protease adaptor protein ClpS